jgi:hypothetical protein
VRNKQLQRTKTRRQAAKDFCGSMDIPLKDAMAMLNTDYASEAHTCGSDTDVSDSTTERRVKAGLGLTAKKVVGYEWRSPDVSEGLSHLYAPKLTYLSSMSPFSAGYRSSLSRDKSQTRDPIHYLSLLPEKGGVSPQIPAKGIGKISIYRLPPCRTAHPRRRSVRRSSRWSRTGGC